MKVTSRSLSRPKPRLSKLVRELASDMEVELKLNRSRDNGWAEGAPFNQVSIPFNLSQIGIMVGLHELAHISNGDCIIFSKRWEVKGSKREAQAWQWAFRAYRRHFGKLPHRPVLMEVRARLRAYLRREKKHARSQDVKETH